MDLLQCLGGNTPFQEREEKFVRHWFFPEWWWREMRNEGKVIFMACSGVLGLVFSLIWVYFQRASCAHPSN